MGAEVVVWACVVVLVVWIGGGGSAEGRTLAKDVGSRL